MKKASWILIILGGLLLACTCSLIPSPSPTVTPDESALQTRVAESVATTLAAMPTATPIPPQPTDTPTPVPTSTTVPTVSPLSLTPEPPDPAYVLQEEQFIGVYAIRVWRNPASEAFMYDNILTISSPGQPQIRVDSFIELGEETGTDITGEGHPDAVVKVFTGGAHCCFSTIVYDLGPVLTKVLETPLSNCDGYFQDLTGDGVLEFITCDDLFAYAYCCFAGSPAVRVVLQYEPGRAYVPAGPRFPEVYEDDITQHLRMAEEATPGGMCEWGNDTKCAVLPLILDYLYSGRTDEAWVAFGRFYAYPDAAVFRAEIEQAVSTSPLFVPGSSATPTTRPPYYMLQLLTNCGPDWQYVGLLTAGQPACDPNVPHRDLFWLSMRLREIGLLGEGEDLRLTPEGCMTNCRLDVVRSTDGARLGSIRLDTTMGYPGDVYRVNGVESTHWRMRGDLTWEQVP
ncbi:MAG: hypothetical protein ACUVWZ_13885 [Anaerolineae bacterium]